MTASDFSDRHSGLCPAQSKVCTSGCNPNRSRRATPRGQNLPDGWNLMRWINEEVDRRQGGGPGRLTSVMDVLLRGEGLQGC
jgi:hypothetical protein